MLKQNAMVIWVLPLAACLLVGCGGSFSGVQAVAPAGNSKLSGRAPDNGEFTLYRATGFNEMNAPDHVAKVWTVSVREGDRIGFRWVNDKATQWDPNAGLHLIAYAGGQQRDLGPVRNRDMKYLWAGSQANLGSYWSAEGQKVFWDRVTMQ